MTGPEFDAATRGKTFIYSHEGKQYGAEQYLFGQNVYWSDLDGECMRGKWYEDAGNICFTYKDSPDPECWQFFKTVLDYARVFLGHQNWRQTTWLSKPRLR